MFATPKNSNTEILFLFFSSTLILLAFSLVCLIQGISCFPDGPVSMIAEVTRSLAQGGGLLPAAMENEVRMAQEMSRENHSFVWQDIVSLHSNGTFVPKHSVLSSVIAVPFYKIFGDSGFWILQQLLVLSVIYSLYKLSNLIFEETYPWSVLLGGFLFSQTLFYSYAYSHDLLGCSLFFVGLNIMQGRSNFRSALGTLVMCLSVIIRPNYLILVLIFTLWGRLNDSWERRSFSILGLALGLSIVGLYGYVVWGNPIAGPYTFVPVFQDGQQVLSSHPIGFSFEELKREWWRKLFSLTGLVPANLGFGLAPLVAIFCWKHRRRKFLMTILGISVIYILYVFSYEMWDISAYGNRFLFPAIYLYLILFVGYLGQFEHLLRNSFIKGNR